MCYINMLWWSHKLLTLILSSIHIFCTRKTHKKVMLKVCQKVWSSTYKILTFSTKILLSVNYAKPVEILKVCYPFLNLSHFHWPWYNSCDLWVWSLAVNLWPVLHLADNMVPKVHLTQSYFPRQGERSYWVMIDWTATTWQAVAYSVKRSKYKKWKICCWSMTHNWRKLILLRLFSMKQRW